MNIKDMLSRPKKGWIMDPMLLGFTLVVATVIMVMLAYLWTQFLPALNTMNTNAAFPVSAQNQSIIDQLGNGYFLQSGPTFLILLFGVMCVALIISAWGENAGIIAIPLGIIALIGMIFVSFLLSDFAHNVLTSAALGTTTALYYSAPLYLLDNLPIITVVLGIGYIIVVLLHRQQPGAGGNYSSRISSG